MGFRLVVATSQSLAPSGWLVGVDSNEDTLLDSTVPAANALQR